jgi:hypothetical protein
MDEPGPGSRYLTDPYIAECLTMEHVQTLLRPLCLDASSSLPRRMRVSCANFVRRLTVFRRELTHQSEAITAERTAELQAETPQAASPLRNRGQDARERSAGFMGACGMCTRSVL